VRGLHRGIEVTLVLLRVTVHFGGLLLAAGLRIFLPCYRGKSRKNLVDYGSFFPVLRFFCCLAVEVCAARLPAGNRWKSTVIFCSTRSRFLNPVSSMGMSRK
jgi:hypothetical protein